MLVLTVHLGRQEEDAFALRNVTQLVVTLRHVNVGGHFQRGSQDHTLVGRHCLFPLLLRLVQLRLLEKKFDVVWMISECGVEELLRPRGVSLLQQGLDETTLGVHARGEQRQGLLVVALGTTELALKRVAIAQSEPHAMILR